MSRTEDVELRFEGDQAERFHAVRAAWRRRLRREPSVPEMFSILIDLEHDRIEGERAAINRADVMHADAGSTD